MSAPAPRRWSQLAPCPACGLAIAVDAAGAPVGEHVGSRLCRELATERAMGCHECAYELEHGEPGPYDRHTCEGPEPRP